MDIAVEQSPPPSEDRIYFLETDAGHLLVLADGAGGIGGGAEAADAVIGAAGRWVEHTSLDLDAPASWAHLLAMTDRQIELDARAGEATAVVVWISFDGLLVGASVGDSGGWLWDGAAGWQELTGAQHRKPRMGTGRARPVAFGPVAAQGRLLLASDGLFDYVRAKRWQPLAGEATVEAAAQRLHQAARLPNGTYHDDLIILLTDLGAP